MNWDILWFGVSCGAIGIGLGFFVGWFLGRREW
jgi:hypothetical protein